MQCPARGGFGPAADILDDATLRVSGLCGVIAANPRRNSVRKVGSRMSCAFVRILAIPRQDLSNIRVMCGLMSTFARTRLARLPGKTSACIET